MPRKGEKMGEEHKRKFLLAQAPFRYKKGQPSANPSGRPVKKPFLQMLKEVMKDNPEVLREIIEQQITLARIGDKDAYKEMRDMMDGKPAQAIVAGTDDEGNALAPPKIDVHFVKSPKKETKR